MGNYLLTIAYDGAGFHGWQKQPQAETSTVQGHLEQVLSRLFHREIRLNGTSRTDAGVHALGQRASFTADLGIPTDRMARVINNALCGAEEGSFALSPVRILDVREMPADFHARFNAKGKKYIYRILPGYGPAAPATAAPSAGSALPVGADIFRRSYVYHVREPLDVSAMQEAAQRLVGTHDFRSFESSGGTPRQTTVRTIFEAGVSAGAAARSEASSGQGLPVCEDEIRIAISGDGFLYNMVRIITGTLVEIGQGRRDPADMTRIIEAKDRRQAGHTAPPYGLYLAEVYY